MKDPIMITIPDGPDAGKTFRVRQMSASTTEEWAGRALLAILNASGGRADAAQLMETAKTSQTAALMQALSGLAGLRWETAKPLLDMLLGQIDRVPNPERPDVVVRLTPNNADAHIEDVKTLLRLRGEALRLSLDFFDTAAPFLRDLGAGLSGLSPQDSSTM